MSDDARNERLAEAHGAVTAATESLERALETLELEGEDGFILLQLDLALAHLNDAASSVRTRGR